MSRWIRLDTTWSQSEWLAVLPAASRLAWVELLCYVKAHGYAGAAKRLTPVVAARVTGVTRNDFECMEKAAIEDGALVIDGGEWIVTGWGDRQSDRTAAERMRKYRERQQQDTPPGQERNVTGVTRNGRHAQSTETETETYTDTVHAGARTEWPAKPKKAGGQYEYPEPFERAWASYPRREGSNPKVGAYKAFRARVKSGDEPEDLATAAEHYRQHCQATEKEGTAYVQQASTFWGPSEPWRDFLEPPSANGNGHWSQGL